MDGQRTSARVKGMTCPACVGRVEKALRALPGVAEASADLRRGAADIGWKPGAEPDEAAVSAALAAAGYSYGGPAGARKAGGPGGAAAIALGVLLAAGYFALSARGSFNAIPEIGSGIGLGALFIVGLLTSVHCVSMCGGIALSQGLRVPGGKDGGEARVSWRARARSAAPTMLYNAGRVIGYSAVGAAVGGLGSALSFSDSAKAVITLAAAVFMVLVGLRNLGLVKLPSIASRLPARARAALEAARGFVAKGGPFAVGVLNAFIPCGPLQAMQLYALGTGSALMGALSMAAFALGTVPLMAGFALTAVLLPRRIAPILVKAGAVLTLALGFATFGRAAALAGIPLPGSGGGAALAAEPKPAASSASGGRSGPKAASERVTRDRLPPGVPVAEAAGGYQAIETVFTAGSYAPFAVVAGVPVKWTIRISAADLNGCNRTVIVPAYRIKRDLRPGINVIEFTPKESGVVSYSCWMGMIRSAFAVLDE